MRRSLTDRLLGAGAFFVFIFITTVLGGSLLKFLGMEYSSFWDVFLFFTLYFVLDFLLGFFLTMLLFPLFQQAVYLCRRVLFINFFVSLITGCFSMILLDYLMDSLKVPLHAVFIFTAVFCLGELVMGWRRTKLPIRVYLFEKKTDCGAESRELLMEVLAMYCADYGIDFNRESTKIEDGDHGKPVSMKKKGDSWILREDLHFSVSHTRNWWLCAVYDQPIGVDIEERGRVISSAAAEKVFTPEEREWLSQVGFTSDHMLDLWVRKEAYVKYLGTGISEGLQTFSAAGQGELFEYVGEEGKAAFCSFLIPEGMRDTEGFPVPLTGAFCTEYKPVSLEVGFLERPEDGSVQLR